ncbi:MAG: hypothetical protein JJU29_11890 [Verrucomicrobia bacterium]|nr:hypothetical protein [Verrucomicrobiota bacterium]MCH8514147.1 hypothetical protein [Kiritimatiellia bacterium]
MRIPPHWARGFYTDTDKSGQPAEFVAFGWSFESIQDARKNGVERAKRVFEMVRSGKRPEKYEYHDRPIREEILERIGEEGAESAIITRNRYGALVLNCSRVMFVDIDFPAPKAKGFWDGVLLLFSGERRRARREEVIEDRIRKVQDWAAQNPARAFRMYRTLEGLRLLFTDKLYEPAAEETARIFTELGADPLYMKLTEKQECFRARLTAKPWRCQSPRPPVTFPREKEDDERLHRDWLQAYNQHSQNYKVCDWLEAFGTTAENPEITAIVNFHDQAVQTTATKPLA